MLRHGGAVWIRGGKIRGFQGDCRGGAASGGAIGGTDGPRSGGRIQLQRADRSARQARSDALCGSAGACLWMREMSLRLEALRCLLFARNLPSEGWSAEGGGLERRRNCF